MGGGQQQGRGESLLEGVQEVSRVGVVGEIESHIGGGPAVRATRLDELERGGRTSHDSLETGEGGSHDSSQMCQPTQHIWALGSQGT